MIVGNSNRAPPLIGPGTRSTTDPPLRTIDAREFNPAPPESTADDSDEFPGTGTTNASARTFLTCRPPTDAGTRFGAGSAVTATRENGDTLAGADAETPCRNVAPAVYPAADA